MVCLFYPANIVICADSGKKNCEKVIFPTVGNILPRRWERMSRPFGNRIPKRSGMSDSVAMH
ncbi:hypothetical protein HMPREF9137_0300 [Prevotella denticola F0289]|nr:hypothetical protein HMPREF9137_0300 [Prevotella denticola F0289]